MIDLSKQNSKPYEFKMVDGTILKIKKPSHQLLLDMVRIKDNKEVDEVLDELGEIFLQVINSNLNGKLYSKEILQKIPYDDLQLVIEDYFNYTNSLLGE